MATDRRNNCFRPHGSVTVTSVRDRAPPEALVTQAEENLGIADDSHQDQMTILDAGESVQVDTSSTALDITVGANEEAIGETTYTADQLDAQSTRLAAVLHNDSRSEASWDFGSDIVLIPTGDGRVSITDQDGNFLGGIDEPWAVDATGSPVDTSYTVEGTTLVQNLATDDSTSYPVVADPTVRLYPGYYQVNFNRNESSIVLGGVGGCYAFLSKATHPALRALSLVCGGLSAYGTARLAGGRCLRVNVAGLPPAAWTWWPSYPKC
ncbi:MAG: hypothetical protein Q4C81_02260 [Kocuria sp.]|nr:hypothetical protein [Kocuria sp.]